jgi:hypothetical protein
MQTKDQIGNIDYAQFAKSATGKRSKKLKNNSENRAVEERSNNDLNDRASHASAQSDPRLPKKVQRKASGMTTFGYSTSTF